MIRDDLYRQKLVHHEELEKELMSYDECGKVLVVSANPELGDILSRAHGKIELRGIVGVTSVEFLRSC